MSLLEIKEISVHFITDQGIVEAIDRASLSIEEGQVMGLVGESGCGKTTIGRTVLRVLPDQSGRVVSGSIYFRGENLLELSEKEVNTKIRGRAITIIPQDPSTSFNPVFTIGAQFIDIVKHKASLENQNNRGKRGLVQQIVPSSSKEMKKQIIEMLRSVQIPTPEKQLHKYPHEFSGGQRQRIIIAMALASRPSLIISDEATTALDVTIEAQILILLRNLAREYRTSVLFITHDLAVAKEICDRITVMYAGQIMEAAPVESFFESPCHPYTKGLLDSLPNPKGNIRTIEGDIPPLINPPKGCRFHPRCPRALPHCEEGVPEAVKISPDHIVRCFNRLSV